MILDSEEQRSNLMALLTNFTVNGTIQQLRPTLVTIEQLMQALQMAEIKPVSRAPLPDPPGGSGIVP